MRAVRFKWRMTARMKPQVQARRWRTGRALQTVFGLAALTLAVGAVLIWRSPEPACPASDSIECAREMPPAPGPETFATTAAASESPAPVQIAAGVCPLELLPAGYVQALDDAAARDLIAQVSEWLADEHGREPSIAHARGAVFVESEEDRGDDPPYPSSARPEAERVCGSAAGWLRSELRRRLAWRARIEGELVCQDNVCCYTGMEFAPEGLIVFRRADGPGGSSWALDAWVQLYQAALPESIARVNARFVTSSLWRLAATRCPGEPPGAF